MHPKTYDIQEFSSQPEADKQGFTIPLSRSEAEELSSMNRKQRRAWLSKQRRNKNDK